MIKAKDAIRVARSLIGTPYAKLDCINLIKRVIRDAPGGVRKYTTAGTNALWDSFDSAPKYKDLTWRQEGITGARAGMLAFKRDGEDVHHVGIVTGEGTVIHSSSTQGGRGVVETSLSSSEGWNLLAVHRYIETADAQEEAQEDSMRQVMFQARVVTADGALNLRKAASMSAEKIGSLPKGALVDVYETGEDFWLVGYMTMVGWAAEEYLTRVDFEEGPEDGRPAIETTTLISEDGQNVMLVGKWRVAED